MNMRSGVIVRVASIFVTFIIQIESTWLKVTVEGTGFARDSIRSEFDGKMNQTFDASIFVIQFA